jgi:hypothetical protein
VDIPYYAGVYYTFLMPLLAEMSVWDLYRRYRETQYGCDVVLLSRKCLNNSNFSADEAQTLEKTKIVMDESKDSHKVGQWDLQHEHTSLLALELHSGVYWTVCTCTALHETLPESGLG